jgi:Tfp pilus assembly protein PilZ
METHACVVVAQDTAIRDFLAALLNASGVSVVPLASLGELPGTLATVPASGILLELASLVTASAKDKKAAEEILEFYPCAKFRFDHQQIFMAGETLDQFLNKCLQFKPRLARQSMRKIVHLAVYLSARESLAGAEKAVTINVCDKGVFVSSARKWSVGQRVWLKFPGHATTIAGVVRSYQPWGSSKSFPGIGIEIDANAAGWLASC